MSTLRPAARLYLAVIAASACALAAAGLAHTPPLPAQRLALAALFLALMAAAYLFPLPFAAETKLCLDSGVILAAILLFDPGIAIVVVGVGTLAAQLLRREPADQATFNAAQTMLQAAAGGFVLAAANWSWTAPRLVATRLDRPLAILGLVGACVAMYAINTGAIAGMIALQNRTPLVRAWWESTADTNVAEWAAHLAQLGIGLLAAIVAAEHPWALTLLALPTLAVYGSFDHHVRDRRRTEHLLQGSEANLAEAQRIAHLGSWTWDLASGDQIWSDETYRLFGFAPHGVPATQDAFLRAVHPDDRDAVTRAVRAALAGDHAYLVEHRVVLGNGTARWVREQGEVVADAAGRPVRIVGTVLDITDRKELEAQLVFQAYHDPLTGLPNRTLFNQRLEDAVGTGTASGSGVAVLFLDLDRFKLINDTLGHHAGDHLLVEVAERLRACLPPTDTVARLGGDEFTVLVTGVRSAQDPVRRAGRILDAITAPFSVAGHEVFVTTSIGIAVATGPAGRPADLLRDADVALYQAKANGKGCSVVFDGSMGAASLARMTLETDLWRAAERDEFVVYYQPQVELATGRVYGMEALVRWRHPQRGLVPPAEFIPLAEDTGLILPLGRWVLVQACRQGRIWQDLYPADPPQVSVNLSARQFRHPDLVAEVERVLRRTGFAPPNLHLEITESTAMDDAAQTTATLRALKDLGVRIAIDDFGTGYSSLSYLKRFPVDVLKIDRSFVGGLGRDRDGEDAAIAHAVVGLARALGLRVVAEGIERDEQRNHLRRLGCALGQGYLYAQPLPAADAGCYLAAGRAAQMSPLVAWELAEVV